MVISQIAEIYQGNVPKEKVIEIINGVGGLRRAKCGKLRQLVLYLASDEAKYVRNWS